LLLIFTMAFLSSGWFTYKISSATDKIFTENISGGSPVLRGKKLKGDEDRINLLLIGIGGPSNDAPNLSDTIQVVSIDPHAKRVAMLSIPRDLYVQVPDGFQKAKINEVHAIGEDQAAKGGGPALLKESVSDIVGVPIHYFIRVDFDGFKQVVDSLGGIDINVTERLYDPYFPRGQGYQVLDIRPGEVHMDGDLALKYARSRETTSDFDRSRRQQEVMVAARDKATSVAYLTNPAKLSQLIDILGDHVKTDLKLSEAERLAEIVRDIPSANVTSKVLDGSQTGLLYDSIGPGGAYILLPRSGDYSDIREFAAQLFSSSKTKEEAAQIEVQNASGRVGLAKSESDLIGGYGFAIVGVSNAPAISPKTIIYDYTNGQKSATVNFLTKRYRAQTVRQAAPKPGVDLLIVIGTDYINQPQGQTAR
jgi:polyisoprenyl-teichoic acid--peptidoglycan teichoic acid transferase